MTKVGQGFLPSEAIFVGLSHLYSGQGYPRTTSLCYGMHMPVYYRHQRGQVETLTYVPRQLRFSAALVLAFYTSVYVLFSLVLGRALVGRC